MHTNWTVPIEAKLTSSYSAVVNVLLTNTTSLTPFWTAGIEGSAFTVSFPFMLTYR